jgi:hypothetical protein
VPTKGYNSLDVQMTSFPSGSPCWTATALLVLSKSLIWLWMLEPVVLCVCIHTHTRTHSSAPVPACNTFQDLPWLSETADNTERYKTCYLCNIHKYVKFNWQIRAFWTQTLW